MATRVTRKWSGVELSWSRDRGWVARRDYVVTGPTRASDVYTAIDAVTGERVPPANSSHPENALLLVDAITPKQSDPGVWDVAVSWSMIQANSTGSGSQNPLTDWPVAYWEEQSSSEPVDADTFDNPIVNSAADAFDPPLTRDYVRRVLTIEANLPFYDVELADKLEGTINDNDLSLSRTATVGTLKRGTGKLLSFIPIGQYQLGPKAPKFVRCRWRILRDPMGFRRRLIDQGRAGWWSDGGTPRKHNFYSKNGADDKWTVVGQDVRLNGKGKPIFSDKFKVTELHQDPIELKPQPWKVGENGVLVEKSATGDGYFLKFLLDGYADWSDLRNIL